VTGIRKWPVLAGGGVLVTSVELGMRGTVHTNFCGWRERIGGWSFDYHDDTGTHEGCRNLFV